MKQASSAQSNHKKNYFMATKTNAKIAMYSTVVVAAFGNV